MDDLLLTTDNAVYLLEQAIREIERKEKLRDDWWNRAGVGRPIDYNDFDEDNLVYCTKGYR
jgi:hypothetical protein